jgi:DNA-binding beta-propeller fold protein YncE
MRRFCFAPVILSILSASLAPAQQSTGPYRVLKTIQLGGAGTFDTAFADVPSRRLYIPRKNPARITVFDLDTLQPAGEIPDAAANGVVIDPKSGRGFAGSKPVVAWDAKTLKVIKTIDVQGGPDAMLFDPFNERVYVFSHVAPNATIIDAAEGAVLGTIDLGGMPEQAATDGKGHVYVDIRDRNDIAVIDAKTMQVSGRFGLEGKGGRCSGLAIDVKNGILFAGCREPQTMVILRAADGKILETLPIGAGVDSAIFNPKTMETYSAQVDGTLTIVKEASPTSFAIEQTLQTKPSAKQMVWDSKTDRILLVAADAVQPPPPAGAPAGSQWVPGSFSVVIIGK